MSSDRPDGKPAHLSNLTSSFGKDLDREERLAAMNALLQPVQREIEAQRAGAVVAASPIFVLGPPRSGTTLTSQLLSSSRLFGFVSNFVARFWQAPAVGMIIEAALGLAEGNPLSSFESRRGTTAGWREPSEFGYFWSRHFDLGQATHCLGDAERARFDIEGLRHSIAVMEGIAGRRIVFKNNSWFTLNAGLIAEAFPACLLVVCERDPFYVAQSIWQQRLELYGDHRRWWSVRPANFEEIARLDPLEQVAAQAVSIAKGMEASLAEVGNPALVRVPYERLANDPRGVVSEIALASGVNAAEVSAAVSGLPERLDSTDHVRLGTSQAAKLRRYVDRWLNY